MAPEIFLQKQAEQEPARDAGGPFRDTEDPPRVAALLQPGVCRPMMDA